MKPTTLLFSLALAAALLTAQTPPPGTVSVSTNVVATAGTDTNTQVVCTFSIASGIVHADCNVGAAQHVHTSDNKPVPGNANGYIGSMNANNNAITWLIQQPTAAGPINWQIAANGTTKSGSF